MSRQIGFVVDLALLGSIVGIIVINIVLSGDNAIVIALASRRLTPRDRKRAIVLGGAGAILLRVVCTMAATILLGVPFVQLIGGLLLVWIAYRLLADGADSHEIEAAASFWGAIQTIVVADLLMSLDNILAVGGASHGSFALLLFGLIASMPIILFGSTLVAWLMTRFRWLAVAGAVVLTTTSARMVAEDEFVLRLVPGSEHVVLVLVLAVVFALVAVVGPRLRGSLDRSTA
jgi:YjbE family integral membrane protein